MKDVCQSKIYTKSMHDEKVVIHPELLSSLSYCLMKSGQMVRSKMDEILHEYNLITPQLGILIIINNSKSINQLQLGEQLGIDKATMVKLIDSLEKNKLVERTVDLNDRRAKLIKITNIGTKFTKKMILERISIEEEFLKSFSKKDNEMIRKLLPQILTSFYHVSKS
jgi:DNA-binding MarR family transcriptional regulator